MDLDIIQSTKEGEITQFLCDVRDYFKASLATSEYENTSNMFYLTAAESTEQLLNRCECLLNRLQYKNLKLTVNSDINASNTFSPLQTMAMKHSECHSIRDRGNVNVKNAIGVKQNNKELDNEEVSYLDMSASKYNSEKEQQPSIGKVVKLTSSGNSDNTFRCSTLVVRQNKSFLHRLHDAITITATATDDEAEIEIANSENHKDKIHSSEDDNQIYDICQVTTEGSDGEEDEMGLEETRKVITSENAHFSLPNIDCPYIDLPAGHLSIKKSIKYGQLLKIEKRLFFDQSKKCYCGILNDWLLCYADGPTSNRPTISLYLKMPGIEIEHFGEGKRREICFQIITGDLAKKCVFQAANEIDAKEWIHAIEAAIRNDISDTEVRNSSTRKLPTPPVVKKISFLNSFQGGTEMLSSITSCDGIYEEPSSIHQITPKSISENRPQLPLKQSNTTLDLANKYEYDIPKSPPQPFKDNSENNVLLINSSENNENNSTEKTHTIMLSADSAQKLNLKMEENLDFQAKVKDVHSKLTSQLSSGPHIKKSLKKFVSSTSQNSAETIISLPSPTSPLPETSELKKQKKATTPSNSPQKLTNEKSSFAKNWFLNRLNKTTSSTRSNPSSPSNSPSKCKQSEKENLLNSSSDISNGYDMNCSAKSASPSSGTSKVNMIINQLEASGHFSSMFNVDGVSSLSSFCDNDLNNYEPIMAVSTTPTRLMKKV